MSEVAPLDPQRIIRTLAAHKVEYVMIGALAARLQGFPRLTAGLDITPSRTGENLSRLASALEELNARVYTEAVPGELVFDCSAASLSRASLWNLITDGGRVDLAFEPSGTAGFEDLVSGAVRFDVYGTSLLAARLKDIIRSKEAANRPQDRQDVLVMREMLRRSTPGG